jgi:CelD/BcsL family acetyltransferase involved in cellulose biosynthesis
MAPPTANPFRFERGGYPDLATSAGAPDLWREWDVLADWLEVEPFLRPGWFRAWHQAYGSGEFRVLTVSRNGTLAGVLPVELRGRASLSPTNTHTPLYAPVATDPDVERSLAAQLVAESRGRVELAYVDPTSSWYRALAAELDAAGMTAQVEPLLRSPYVTLGQREGDYPAGVSRRFMKDLRRCRRRLEERGAVELTVHEHAAGLDLALAEFVALEASGWKADLGTAVASREASLRFYADLAGWAAQRGWLRLAFLRLDGDPIAAELDLEYAGRLYALKCGFDTEFRSFGPGQLLTHLCIEYAAEAGLASYEFLGTDEPYKMHWTSTTRERARVQAFPSGLGGRLQSVSRRHLRPLGRRLRRR